MDNIFVQLDRIFLHEFSSETFKENLRYRRKIKSQRDTFKFLRNHEIWKAQKK